MNYTQAMDNYLQEQQENLKELIRQLCAIPAPSHHEEKRAEFCKKWFEAVGGENVHIDDALNAVCPYNVTENNPVVVIMAHTDTVFPDTEPMPFRETEDKFYCPGVCDDTANLAVMMICAKYFLQNRLPSKYGILFVANSCEEGLGNLKGSREIVAKYGTRIHEFITFDGTSLNKIANEVVGSHRYQITVTTEGGHSFANFGNRNSIACLAALINDLYGVTVPNKPGTKTTYNVGIVSGGTSVNTIAQSAQMLYEYRSDDKECLAYMRSQFERIVDVHRVNCLSIDVQLIGERPCSGDMDEARQQALIDKAVRSITRVTGLEPVFRSSSTDCNIPQSLGIPAICMGICVGKGVHTREEEISLDSLLPGSRLCMDFLCNYFH